MNMKVSKERFAAISATGLVLFILLSGAVFAFSTRQGQLQNSSNSPLPNDEEHSTNSTSTSEGHEHENENHSSTSVTHTEEHENETSTSHTSENETEVNEHKNETETHTFLGNETQLAHELEFRIVPVNNFTGHGEANIEIHGTVLDIDVEIERTNASTTFNVILLAISSSSTTTLSTSSSSTTSTSSVSQCTNSIGTLVTNSEGNGQAHLQATLQPGNYQIGLVLCSNGKAILRTDPQTRQAIVPQGKEGENETETEHHEQVNATHADKHDEDEIKNATAEKKIPAVIHVSNSGQMVTQIDPRFSVSVGKIGNGDGLLISISAENVTGSRVLLINITNGSIEESALKSLVVTLDGKQISQATSITQLFNSSQSDPARYIILLTSSGVQLLVSIPHFSLHIIQVLPGPIAQPISLAFDVTLLLSGLFITTIIVAAVYAKRRKVYSTLM